MKLEDVCLITEDVARLAGFYERVLQQPACWEGDAHASFPAGGGLSVYAKAAAEADMGFSFPDWGGAGRATLGFRVADVDAEYRRLTALGAAFITEPKTYPWGARSAHFRDPDGNIITIRCRPGASS